MAIDCSVISLNGRGNDRSVFQPLVIALGMIQIDTLIPISLNREKYGTHGILGTASGYASMRDL